LSDKKRVYSQNDYWKTSSESGSFEGFNDLTEPLISAKLVNQETNKVTFIVSNPTKTPAIGLKFNLRDSKNGKLILPAYFSDGYFSLLPGEKKQMIVEGEIAELLDYEIVTEGFNLKSKSLISIKSK